MLVKYQGIEIDDYDGLFLKSANGITGVQLDPDSIPKTQMIGEISNEISMCIMGDGAVDNAATRKGLNDTFGSGYFEDVLHNAYVKRVAKDYLSRFLSLQIIFDTISRGIDSIIASQIYNLPDDYKMNVSGCLIVGNKILCYPCTHNEQNLKWYKSIINNSLDKIDWIIDAYNGKLDLETIGDIHNYVADRLMPTFRQLSELLKIKDMPLDLSRHLNKYHFLPTEKLYAIEPWHFIEIVEMLSYSKRYNEFIKKLSSSINNEETQLRHIPKEIEEVSSMWFLSLNWCNSDIVNSQIKNLIKIHGTCKIFESMVLPTQEFRDNATLTDKKIDWISFNLMHRCTTLYIWGTSLSDYDVEVHFLISAAKKLQKIVVIDPNKEVVAKVMNLIDVYRMNPNIQVIYFAPRS